MNTISIVQVSNGFILTMHDADSNQIDIAIAQEYDVRSYSSTSLITAIEAMFARNRVKPAIKPAEELPV